MEYENPEIFAAEAKIMYSKNAPSWRKTIYIVGLPRSGKSTVYNVLASCKHVEALEEPFDLMAVAQKSSQYSPKSEAFMQYQDLYHALMENNFSELVLGRIYNFRRQDKSCVFNYKSEESVEISHSRARRIDVLNYSKANSPAFVIAFNDIERSIEFIGAGVPSVQFVYVRRNVLDVARDIAEKEWLSNDQLSTQANMAPAYRAAVYWGGKKIYIPYIIPIASTDLFLSLEVFERSLMYAILQDKSLNNAIKKSRHLCQSIIFEDLIRRPDKVMSALIQELELEKTEMTEKNIDLIKLMDVSVGEHENPLGSLNLSDGLRRFLHENIESASEAHSV